jgi:hypothetical protein
MVGPHYDVQYSISWLSDNTVFSLFWTTGWDELKVQQMYFNALEAGVFQQFVSAIEVGVNFNRKGLTGVMEG